MKKFVIIAVVVFLGFSAAIGYMTYLKDDAQPSKPSPAIRIQNSAVGLKRIPQTDDDFIPPPAAGAKSAPEKVHFETSAIKFKFKDEEKKGEAGQK